jgi:hypothetical protein
MTSVSSRWMAPAWRSDISIASWASPGLEHAIAARLQDLPGEVPHLRLVLD